MTISACYKLSELLQAQIFSKMREKNRNFPKHPETLKTIKNSLRYNKMKIMKNHTKIFQNGTFYPVQRAEIGEITL